MASIEETASAPAASKKTIVGVQVRMKLQDVYKGGLSWLASRTFFLTRHGSHAYGTSRPESDLDIRGVAVAPKEFYLGYLNHFEQAVSKDPDLVVFDIQKFFKLAADGNPNALEIIFTDPSDHLHVTPEAETLLRSKHLFLSRKAKHTFGGYAYSQLKRIKLHRKYLLNPITRPPTRAEFNLPEQPVIAANQLAAAQAAVEKKLSSWNLTDLESVDSATRIFIQEKMVEMLVEAQISTDPLWKGSARVIGYNENFIELLDRERQYNARQKEWDQYQVWLRDRNPMRAELEVKFGFDCKHAMHLVRLLRSCRELLETGVLNVRRPDAEELRAIRDGAWSYDQLVEYSENEHKQLDEVVKTSPLPKAPDYGKLDELCMALIESFA